MSNKLIINFTPTGMIPTKKLTPHVPVSVAEIVEDVHRASELGITMAHVHARLADSGEPTYNKEIYGAILEGIRQYAPYLVVCVSLSGRNFGELHQRAEPLTLEGNLKPDFGSLTLSSLNFHTTASRNAPDMVQSLARVMKEKGILPELEVFDAGMINYAHYLEKKGLIEGPYYYNLLLGNIASAQANFLHTGMLINDLPQNAFWALAGLGHEQLKMNAMAIAMGGGVRVGIEDNIWYDVEKKQLARNIDLLQRVHTLAEIHEREIMSPQEFRKEMNMEPGNGVYGRKQRVPNIENVWQ